MEVKWIYLQRNGLDPHQCCLLGDVFTISEAVTEEPVAMQVNIPEPWNE